MPARSDLKARATAAVEANRDEILAALARDPCRPGARLRGASRCREGCGGDRRPRVLGGAPGRPAGHRRPRPAHRRPRAGRAAHRSPGRVRRAAGPWSRLWPQHHGGVGRGCRDRPGRRARLVRGRGRLPGHAGRGAGERQAVHARRRALRGARRGAPVPPGRPRHGRLPAPRERRRGRHVRRPRRARGQRAVGGEERARRGDPAVPGGGALAPAAAAARPRPRHRHGGRHGGEHHPGAGHRAVHDPEHRPGLLSSRCGSASGRSWKAPR